MITKCNVGSWIRSWNRKRALVKNLVNSEVYNFVYSIRPKDVNIKGSWMKGI